MDAACQITVETAVLTATTKLVLTQLQLLYYLVHAIFSIFGRVAKPLVSYSVRLEWERAKLFTHCTWPIFGMCKSKTYIYASVSDTLLAFFMNQ